jgi:hypothetical protein
MFSESSGCGQHNARPNASLLHSSRRTRARVRVASGSALSRIVAWITFESGPQHRLAVVD